MLALKVLTFLFIDEDENQETILRKVRKHWVRPWLGNKQLFGCYYSSFQEIKRDFLDVLKEWKHVSRNSSENLPSKIVVNFTLMRDLFTLFL